VMSFKIGPYESADSHLVTAFTSSCLNNKI